ncbi:uncharacterized protein BO97DRAFT_178347 [Aspergillus homomorphus CBS 101889]|uniref:Uncharacterized protein n=1 Tax=Aspergillus homomorphus (strain CBS 101889) TaxID=1450537 RepID=A0A395I6Y9_ASPHC|nr:hypothetical protein BO97DRAFT_178347 [Aspergillus homomorphus CBS 101889]RAL15972.1 hypothetical protein BO97DRAFT_178347 [Aspergillus homomorphus CBS 101889]
MAFPKKKTFSQEHFKPLPATTSAYQMQLQSALNMASCTGEKTWFEPSVSWRHALIIVGVFSGTTISTHTTMTALKPKKRDKHRRGENPPIGEGCCEPRQVDVSQVARGSISN